MTGLILSIIVSLALMADAFTTYHGIKNGVRESNSIRMWVIRKSGLVAGTFGFSALLAAITTIINLYSEITVTVVFLNVLVTCALIYVAYNNYKKT